MKKVFGLFVFCILTITLLVGCEKDKETNNSSAVTTISESSKIPEEGIVDDMEDYIDMLE